MEATERCLAQYPANVALQKNKRYFQNRLAQESPRHVALSLPSSMEAQYTRHWPVCATNNADYAPYISRYLVIASR